MCNSNLNILSPLWLRSLQDYARIRLESDIVALSSSKEGLHASSSGGIDSMYSAATKEVVLPVSILIYNIKKNQSLIYIIYLY